MRLRLTIRYASCLLIAVSAFICVRSVFMPHWQPYVGDPFRIGDRIEEAGTPTRRPLSLLSLQDTNIVLYLNAANVKNVQDVAYAAFLWRHNQPRVSFTVITGGRFPQLEQMDHEGTLPFRLINDSSFALAHVLKVQRNEDRLIVFARSGAVLFNPPAGLIRPDDLRQLRELYGSGTIEYPEAQPVTNEIGRPFPDIQVREIRSGRLSSLQEVAPFGETQYLVFTASCPVCALERSLQNVEQIVSTTHAAAIFSSRFPTPLLSEFARQHPAARHLYVATGELHGLESLLIPYTTYANSGFLVHTDRQGIIVSIQPLH